MENGHENRGVVVHPRCARGIEEEIIPELFPTWKGFLKIVGLGLAITLAQYGILILLLVKHQ